MKIYKKSLKRRLKEKHKGAVGFEALLQMPVIFAIFMICIMFFFTVLTYVSYNNVANTIAQSLDMRATGYKSTNGTVLSYEVTGGTHYNVDGNNVVNGSSIRTYGMSTGSVTGQDPVLLGGLNAAINTIAGNKKGNQLNMPFTAIKSITAYNDRPIDLTSSKNNAGNTIKVIVEYYPISFKGSNDKDGNPGLFGSITIKAVGYATIS